MGGNIDYDGPDFIHTKLEPPSGEDLAVSAVRITAAIARFTKTGASANIEFDAEGRLLKVYIR